MEPLQTLSPQQSAVVNWALRGESAFVTGSAGTGKCLSPCTEVLLDDGVPKRIDKVVVGDRLLGDNGTPREVLTVTTGTDMMYRIKQKNAEDYVCNGPHILVLKYSGHRNVFYHKAVPRMRKAHWVVEHLDRSVNLQKVRVKKVRIYHPSDLPIDERPPELVKYLDGIPGDNTVEITVDEFLKLPKHVQKQLKGYRSSGWDGDDESRVPFDPWVLGLWLGDGCKSNPTITSADKEVITELQRRLQEYNMKLVLRKRFEVEVASQYYMGIDGDGVDTSQPKSKPVNPFMKFIRDHGVIRDKHIPKVFMHASRDIRRQLLAGLMDSDGWTDDNCGFIGQKDPVFAAQICTLIRSLGLHCSNIRALKKTTTPNGKQYEGWHHRLSWSGEGQELVTSYCSLARKKLQPRGQRKDAMVTGIEVESVGVGPYVGVTIDGNRRFCLSDFTVTHNSFVMDTIEREMTARGKRVFRLAPTGGAAFKETGTSGQTVESFFGVGLLSGNGVTAQKVTSYWWSVFKYKRAQSNGETGVEPLYMKVHNSVILLDEVGMLDEPMTALMDLLLQAAANNSRPFGGVTIMAFGDFCQLQRTPGRPAFRAAVWDLAFTKQCALGKIFRQQGDTSFAQSLERARFGVLNDEDIGMFQKRAIGTAPESPPGDAYHLFTHRKRRDTMNQTKIQSLPLPEHVYTTFVNESSSDGPQSARPRGPSAQSDVYEALGIDPIVKLRKDAPVVLVVNLDVTAGLFNGARGVVIGFTTSPTGDSWPLVEFEHGRRQPIQYVKFSRDKGGIAYEVNCVPLRLAFASTVHQAQGRTLPKAVVSVDSTCFAFGHAYVQMSRTKTLNDLWFTRFDPSWVRADKEIVRFYKEKGLLPEGVVVP
jgi:hypothetical protein